MFPRFRIPCRRPKASSRSAGGARVWRWLALLIGTWTLVVAGSAGWNVWREKQATLGVARMEALAHFDKDIAYRHWAAGLGGVYAPVTEETPPNPYLGGHPERDIETPSGRRLTLINPAYMTRLVHELTRARFGALGHITSRAPVRPENAPDAWEDEALRRIEEEGRGEVTGLVELGGREHLRLMRPLITQPGCLKCHADHAELGEVRGGISVAIPMAPFRAAESDQILAILSGHGVIWLIGLAGIFWGFRRLRRDERQRSLVEGQLREQKERLDATLHSIGDGVISTDQDGAVADMNPVAEQLTGWPLEKARGRPFGEVFHIVNSRTGRPAPNPVETVLRSGQVIELANHTMLLARDGNRYHIADSAAPIRGEDGKIAGVVIVFHDVTEQYAMREAVRESEERFRDVALVSSDWIWEVDTTGRYTYCSPSVRELLDYSPDEILGKEVFDLMSPDEAHRVRSVFENVCAERRSVKGFENWIVTKQGERKCVLTSAVPLLDAEGNLAGYRGVDHDITQRKNVEEELRHSLDYQTAVFDVSLVGIMVLENRIIVDVNQRMAEMLGYQREELIGKGPRHLHLSEENFVEFGERYYWRMAEGQVTNVEYPLRHRCGHTVWCQFNGRAMVPPDLSKGAVWTIEDITRRKQTEAELNESYARMRELTESITDVLWTCVADEEGRIQETSLTSQADHLLELPEGTLGDSFDRYWNYVHPDDLPRVQAVLGNALREVRSDEGVEYRLITGTGKIKWVHSKGAGKRLADGRVKAFGRTSDITARKLSEQRQLLETRRIEALLEMAQMDDRSAEEIAAFAVEEAIQLTGSEIGFLAAVDEDSSTLTLQYWSDLVHERCGMHGPGTQHAIGTEGLLGEVTRRREPLIVNHYAAPHPRKHGLPDGHLPIDRYLSIPIFESDRMIAVAGVANKSSDYDEHDVGQLRILMNGWWQITERKRREEELRRTRDELQENLMALESANRVLEEFNERAETATRAKSQFLANMSHEIRTPMTAILGFTDVLLGDEKLADASPEAADSLQTIQRNGQYLLRLINDILDLSKIEAGKLETEATRCSPAAVITDMASLMRVRAEAKNLPLTIEYEGRIPETIETDPLRLRQILINLVGNAIKFTETGEVRVRTKLVGADTEEPRLKIDVVDSGIGMSKEQRTRLFQPFSQVDSSMTRQFGGTGLGLTISKRLAEMLGGDITVESAPGQGSTFSVTVRTGPLDQVPLLDAATESESLRGSDEATAARETKPRPDAGGKLTGRVLLAEDGPDNQRLISFLLRKAGADVTVVENGQLARDAALQARDEGEPFDVILMDMQMPVMDGYTATSELRAAGYQGPIIALTAHAMSGAEEECRQAGCDGYAQKPIDRKTLLGLVAQHLRQNAEPAAHGPKG